MVSSTQRTKLLNALDTAHVSVSGEELDAVVVVDAPRVLVTEMTSLLPLHNIA